MGWVVWDKRQPEGVTFAMAELAYSSFKKSVKMFSCSRALIGNSISNNEMLAQRFIKIHPTQKPVELYDWLLKNYANEGDKILDTHVGSASSRIACYKGGFEFTGFELDEDYFRESIVRFKNFLGMPIEGQKQQKLKLF